MDKKRSVSAQKVKWLFWSCLLYPVYYVHTGVRMLYYWTLDAVGYLEEKTEQYEDW